MYKEFFDRLFAKAGVEFRQTRDVLEIVVDAREPLQLAEIARATGLDEDYDLLPVLDHLAPFLPAREFRYALFHKSLSDWLTGKDANTGRKEAGIYHVSLTKGRTRLADWWWAECQHGITKDHLYCLRHLPTHLAEVGRDGDLRTLLLNFNWLQNKLEATDINALVADYEYLPKEADLGTVQSVLRQSAHILAGNPRELPGQLVGRLPGKLSQNVDRLRTGFRTQELPVAPPLYGWLFEVGGAGDFERACEAFKKAQAIVDRLAGVGAELPNFPQTPISYCLCWSP